MHRRLLHRASKGPDCVYASHRVVPLGHPCGTYVDTHQSVNLESMDARTRDRVIRRPRLPLGSPADATMRRAPEVPVGSWVAPAAEAMNAASWRPVLNRWIGLKYAVFAHTEVAVGTAQEMSKFPLDAYVAWCRSRPKFPPPRGADA